MPKPNGDQESPIDDAMAPRSPPEGLTKTIRTLPQPEVYSALETRPNGLSQKEAEERLAHYGKNAISEVKKKHLASFAANFTHPMAILLWSGGLIAFVAGLPQLGIAIWMANLINGIFSYWQEHRAEKAIEALRKMLPFIPGF